MDWSKAKSILILVFLIFNIFLIVNLGIYNFSGDVSVDAIKDTKVILGNRGINIECEIPVYKSELPKLGFEASKFTKADLALKLLDLKTKDADELKNSTMVANGTKSIVFNEDGSCIYEDSKPKDSIDIKTQTTVEKYIKGVLTTLNMDMSSWYTESFVTGKEGMAVTIVMIEKYKKLPVYDNRIEATVTNSGLSKLQFSYRKLMPQKSESKKEVVPAYEILIRSFDGSKKGTVTGIDIGFKVANYGESAKAEYITPVWRIKLKDGIVRYFKAYDGLEIK